jgi:hypothetical protein
MRPIKTRGLPAPDNQEGRQCWTTFSVDCTVRHWLPQSHVIKWILLYFYNYLKPCKAQWSLYVPSCLTFRNSTFCSHSVFMCFVWICEKTAIISLDSINWLVFITETECVYCAVRSAHTVSLCFEWIWEQTAILSLYSINWLVFITETECLLRGTFCPQCIYVFCVDLRTKRLFHYTALTDWFL